tara:strand:+ start:344 stop:763 length:420 start_codon:yes stop_codon:yes gene_type:complete
MNYPPPERISSPTELRETYRKAIEEIASLRKTARNQRAASSENRKEVLEGRKQVKKLNKDILTMTKKEKAAEEASKCGYWSGAAVAFTSILYMIWDRVGYPYEQSKFGAEFWSSEPVFGVISWVITMTFASFYKAAQGK